MNTKQRNLKGAAAVILLKWHEQVETEASSLVWLGSAYTQLENHSGFLASFALACCLCRHVQKIKLLYQ